MNIPPELLQEILAGNCVLFIGAGVTSEAQVGIPGGKQLVRIIARECKQLNPEFDFQAHQNDKLEDIAEVFIRLHSNKAVGRRALERVLEREIPPRGACSLNARTCCHQFIVNIPELNKLIFTTNWDELLEEAVERFTEVRNPNIAWEVSQLDSAPIRIIKLHGTIRPSHSIKITAEDLRNCYTGSGAELWDYFAAYLMSCTVLFVGYGLSDFDFRSLSDAVRRATPGRKHFALQLQSSTAERECWKNKGIQIFEGTAREFFAKVYEETCRFINRGPELQLEMLREWPFYQILGHAGIGKTDLLNRIYNQVRVEQSVRRSAYRYVCHYKFPRNDPHDINTRINLFLQSLSRELNLPVRDIEQETTQRIEELSTAGRLGIDRQAVFDQITHDIASDIANVIRHDSTLLLIDCERTMDESSLRVLGAIMLPAMESSRQQLHVLMGSRYPTDWPPSHWTVKYSFRQYCLKPFDVRDITDAVRYYSVLHADATLSRDDCARIAERIYELYFCSF